MILLKLYSFASFIDYSILLNRLYNKETNSYSELELISILNLINTNRDITTISIERYYFNEKAISI